VDVGAAQGSAETHDRGEIVSYLVTGGTGFIGSHISKLLAGDGGNVVLFDSNPRREFMDELLTREEMEHVTIISGDITDLAHLIRTTKEFGITKIIHMAGLLSMASSANPALAVRINCDGTANVLETARILGLEKVVYASSNTVFGPPEMYGNGIIWNDAPHYPSTVYGACKSFIERLAGYYFTEYGVDSAGLRYGAVYGMGHREGAAATVSRELIAKPALGQPGRVPYVADELINWLYVEDAARGTVMAAGKVRTKTRSFNIDGEICTMAKAVEYVKALIPGADIAFLDGHTGFAGNYDVGPIREEIGYIPQWPLARGIEEGVRRVRKAYD
jgi:UDP-glucose 4-epimerase